MPPMTTRLSDPEDHVTADLIAYYEARARGGAGLITVEMGSPHYTSLGKCLLAFLSEEEREEMLSRLRLERLTPRTITDTEGLREELLLTRERGYATNDEEHEEGVRAVGLPVIGRHGRPAAALSVATLKFRHSMEELEGFVPLLRDAAREVEVQLR